MFLCASVENADNEKCADEILARRAACRNPGTPFVIESVEHWDMALRGVDYLRGVFPL